MKIPKKVTLGLHEIPVKVVYDMKSREFGHYNTHEMYIRLNGNKKIATQEETFFHEILEAADDILELGLKHRQITALGVALHQMLFPSMVREPIPEGVSCPASSSQSSSQSEE